MSNSLGLHGLQSCSTACSGKTARFLCRWISPGMNTGVGRHSLLQGSFLTQGSSPHLLHCRQILYHLSHQGSPYLNKAIIKGYQPFCTAKANNNNNQTKFVLIWGDHFLCLQLYCSLYSSFLKPFLFFFFFCWSCWVFIATSLVVVCRLNYHTAYGILVPQPRMEPVSPALKGGSSTTEPPGKSLNFF